MAVSNLLNSIEISGKSVERANKRDAAAQTAKAMTELGAEIKNSSSGNTDMGQFVSKAIGSNLVDNPVSALQLINFSPEKWAMEIGMRGLKDPNSRAMSPKVNEFLKNINYLKASGTYRAMREAGFGKGSGGDGDGKSDKMEKVKMDLGVIIPNTLSKLIAKYGIKGKDKDGNEIDIPPEKFSFTKNVLSSMDNMSKTQGVVDDMETEIRNQIVSTYPEFENPKAAGARERAVNAVMNMIIESPTLENYGKLSTTGTIEAGDRIQQFQWDSYEAQIPLQVLIDTMTTAPSAEDIGYTVEETVTPGVDVPWYDVTQNDIPEKKSYKVFKGKKKSGSIGDLE